MILLGATMSNMPATPNLSETSDSSDSDDERMDESGENSFENDDENDEFLFEEERERIARGLGAPIRPKRIRKRIEFKYGTRFFLFNCLRNREREREKVTE